MDEALVKDALSGDRTAFNCLIEKYQSRVYGLAYHITGNFADAEDLTQEAFIRAYLDLHQLREPNKFANWLYQVTRNICRMCSLRSPTPSAYGLRKQVSNARALEFLQDAVARQSVSSPAEQVEVAEMQDSVRNVIATLPENEQLTVTLYYMDGLTYREIADFMGVSQSTVKRRLRASRKKLKEELIIMVQDTFQEHKPTPEFTEKVSRKIDSLIGMLGIGQPNLTIEFLAVGNSAVPALIDVLDDESQGIEKVREATNIVGRFGDERAVEPLLKSVHSEDLDLRLASVVSLGSTGDRRAIEPLKRALSDENLKVALAAADSLALEFAEEEGIQFLLQRLEKHHCSRAANTLVRMMEPEAIEPLKRALSAEDKHFRTYAACLLSSWAYASGKEIVTDAPVKEIMIETLKNEEPSPWLGYVADGLIASGCADELLKIAEERTDDEFRKAVNDSLARVGDYEAFQLLFMRLSAPDDEVRHRAAVILGQIGNKAAVEPLTCLLEDEKEYVRLAAITALGKLRYRRVMPELIDLLENGSKFYRSEAAKALACMGDEGLEYVEKALNDGDMWVRWGAVFGLGLSKNPEAIGLLESALNDEHPVVRRYAASALSKVATKN
jgi:RNA polymerase sigma-70 factor (ECF subfamily)